METLSETRSHGGTQGVYRHASGVTGTDMTFAVFVPDHEPGERLPVLWYLSGLTCTHANVMEKGEYRAACAAHGVILIAPDTSPRGDDVPDAPEEYDFGKGAGFYVDATEEPWVEHYRMRSYIETELPALIGENFPADMARQGICFGDVSKENAGDEAVKKMFTPEFRNRLDAIVPFAYLGKSTVARVVDKFILQLELQLAEQNVHIQFDSDARAWLGDKGYDKLYGARPMARLIQEKIKQPLAEELLFGKLAEGGEVHVTVKDGKPAFEMTPAPPKVKPAKKVSAKKKPVKKPETETDEG